jgi:hypothetical protein
MGVPPAPIEPSAFSPTSFDTANGLEFDPLPALASAPLFAEPPAGPLLSNPEPEPVPVPVSLEPVYPVTVSELKPVADLPLSTPVPVPPPLLPIAEAAPSESFQGAPIEDTTADLLRPMLRQWLADNMPRMVEKALHIEVAETVRTGRKPNGQG